MLKGADLTSIKHGGMIHHMAIRVGIGRHDPRGFPAAGIRTLLKSGGGVQHRLGLREACSSPEPIPSNLAIAGRKAFGLSVSDRHLGLLSSVSGRHLRLLSSVSDRHLRLLPSVSDRHLRLLPSLVVTGDPMRSKRRACVARLAAGAMWEGTRHQLQ
jgi:hypothetical protein